VLRLVRSLDKHRALHPALSSRLRELAYDDMLSDDGHDAESLLRVWATVPNTDRVKPYVACLAATALNARGLHDEARLVAEESLTADWDERVVRTYREAAAPAGSAALLMQIEHCEKWLHARPTDAELALTLGSLCLKQKLGQSPTLPGAGAVGCIRPAHGTRIAPEIGADARSAGPDGRGGESLPPMRASHHPLTTTRPCDGFFWGSGGLR
jgi:hypothetical protein